MTIQDFTIKTLAHIGIEDTAVEVVVDEQTTKVQINVSEEESGMLIGRGASTLDAIQRILRLIFQKDETTTIMVSINDYVDRRQEYIRGLAQHAADYVIRTGERKALQLSPSERRIVHIELAEHPQVESVSEGEGDSRILYIQRKST